MFKPADALRILLVEDNPGDQELVRLYMAQASASPVELACVGSLSAARQMIEPNELDVVLLDLGLPDGRGLEVVDRMRSMAADVPIVVLTGSGTLESGLDALEHDAQDYLVKDQLSPAMLSRSIKYAIHRRRWQNQYRHQLSVSPDGIIVVDSKEMVRQLGRDRPPGPFADREQLASPGDSGCPQRARRCPPRLGAYGRSAIGRDGLAGKARAAHHPA